MLYFDYKLQITIEPCYSLANYFQTIHLPMVKKREGVEDNRVNNTDKYNDYFCYTLFFKKLIFIAAKVGCKYYIACFNFYSPFPR